MMHTMEFGTCCSTELLESRLLLAGDVATTILLSSSTPEFKVGGTLRTQITVAATYNRGLAAPTGQVTLVKGTTPVGSAQLADGTARISVPGLPRGYHYLVARYEGDDFFAQSASEDLAVHVGANNVVDILAVYTPQAQRYAASMGYTVRDAVYASVADTNDALLNSRIDLSLEVVGLFQTNYTESGKFNTDLTRLYKTQDGFMDEVHALRDQYGADVITLFEADGDSGGLSYVLDSLTESGNDRYALSIIRLGQAGAPSYTTAHELGHLFGAVHDRENGSTQGLLSDSYGYRFRGNDGVLYHDIMAYDPGKTIPYYANPNVRYQGVPTGSAGSNVARTINLSAPSVAAYRPTAVPLTTRTLTTLIAPAQVQVYQRFRLTARITGLTPNPHLPTGSVTFLEGHRILGSASVVKGVATLARRLPTLGSFTFRAVYQNDDFFGDSMSNTLSVNAYGSELELDGTLRIRGSSAGDTLVLSSSNGSLVTTINGFSRAFILTDLNSILIDCGRGNDILQVGVGVPGVNASGGGGSDSLAGGDGDDTLAGGNGPDTLWGGNGNDTLRGDGGRNLIRGGSGDDLIYARNGSADSLRGGAGSDFAELDDLLDVRLDMIEQLA